jgi:hypothetical protein
LPAAGSAGGTEEAFGEAADGLGELALDGLVVLAGERLFQAAEGCPEEAHPDRAVPASRPATGRATPDGIRTA